MATITVRGTGQAATSPDEASVGLELEALESTAGEALAAVAERTSAAVTLLDELGIDPAHRVTTGATVGEHGEHDREGRWQHRGFRASNRILVRVRELDVIGALIARAVDRAGARVDGPSWTVAPDNPARLVACTSAAVDARRRAEAYASALGVRVGALVAVRDPGTGAAPPPGARPLLRAAAMEPLEALPVQAGEQLVTAVVEVEFQVEQGAA